MTTERIGTIAGVVVLAILSGATFLPQSCHGGPINTSATTAENVAIQFVETQLAADRWRYSYTVSNLMKHPDHVVWSVSLFVSSAVNKEVISVPPGWDYGIGDQGVLIDFFAIGPPAIPGEPVPPGPEIVPGDAKNFVVEYDRRVGSVPFNAWWNDDTSPSGVVQGTGVAVAVPEPASAVLGGAGGFAIAAYCWLRQRRRDGRRSA
jgi:hypothetical protein